jgi:hypothetical protein
VQKIGEYDKEIAGLEKQHDDILRNARHLLILAPIPPKTREEIVVAAGRSDALLTWVRRDIWKMRCHRDILELDIQQDGVDAVRSQSHGDKPVDTPDTAKKMPRMNSKVSTRSRSQPQGRRSPTKSDISPTSMRPRPSTTESMDTFVDDVFRSTVESPASPVGDGWRLPPLQFDVEQQQQQQQQQDRHRGSIASTLLTAASGTSQRQHSWSASSTSSRQQHRLNSPDRSETLNTITRTLSGGDDEFEQSPQEEVRTPDSSITRTMNLDGVASTPESNKTAKGKRRSLQKTLRDVHHNSSVSHRHRRNKESESTVRSADGDHPEFSEATPGLERAQGRFILHGKQASVVQFGDDWPTERMRLRREKWHREHSEPVSPGKEDTRGPASFVSGSPVVRDLVTDGTEDDTASTTTGTAESFVDAAADPYNPTWDMRSDKRNTVIGPAKPAAQSSTHDNNNNTTVKEEQEEEEDGEEKDGESGYEDAKENRRTVIGPSSLVFPIGLGSSSEASGRVNSSDGSGDGLPRAL